MQANIPTTRLVVPPASTALLFGILSTSLAISFNMGSPDLWAWAFRAFAIGGVVGFYVGLRVFAPKETKPLQRPQPVGKSPVEIAWYDEEDGPMQLEKVKTVTDLELLHIAEKAIHNHYRVTYRSISGIIGQTRVSDFQDELTKPGPYRLAYWRSINPETHEPNRNQGIALTKRGKRLMVEHVRQSPTPAQRGRA